MVPVNFGELRSHEQRYMHEIRSRKNRVKTEV
jgi:hypothetical protein